MFKKIAIAAACSIALYGLAKLIHRHILLEPDGPNPDANDELPETGVDAAAPESGMPIGDSADPITTETPVDQAPSVQGSDAGGSPTAVQVAGPAQEAPCL